MAKSLQEQLHLALQTQVSLRQRSVTPEDYVLWVAHRLRQRSIHAVVLVTFIVMALLFFVALQNSGVSSNALQQYLVLAVLVAIPLCVAIAWAMAARFGKTLAFPPNAQGMATIELARWCSSDYVRRLSEADWAHIAEFVRWPLADRRRAYDMLFAEDEVLPPLRIARHIAALTPLRMAFGWLSIVALTLFIFGFNQEFSPSIFTPSFTGWCFVAFTACSGLHFVLKGYQFYISPEYIDAKSGVVRAMYEKFAAVTTILFGGLLLTIAVLGVLLMTGSL